MKEGGFWKFLCLFSSRNHPENLTELKHSRDMNSMQVIVNRANEIINERMTAWNVDETTMGATELRQLQKCAFEIARNEFMIGMLEN